MTAPGTGRGVITADGCAVELYRQLPPSGEAELVHAEVPANARILDLGCGTGRIAHRLIELGHEVVAVDQSAAMLACVHGARTVCAPIAGLDLGTTFGAVLMASHLVNVPDDAQRHELLSAAVRHLSVAGRLVAQWHPPAWFDRAVSGTSGTVGDVRVELADVQLDRDLLDATVRYRSGDDLWTQTFRARRLTESALRHDLRRAGLEFAHWSVADRTWFAAVRAS
ncbi:MAG TPA: class I SAM-dependent methyltransferase [Jatrophihabitans sp.]|nr:class I SAM-dependent methyltransferase [Jatrophihabitans sp.]